jgi:hypothetical protein
MEMVQIKVYRPVENSDSRWHRTTWVDKSWGAKVGDGIVFTDEPNIVWGVEEVYSTITKSENLNTKWGLELPKSQRTER